MPESREQHIRERAHAIWEQEGRPEGRHDEHWQQASREIGEAADHVPRANDGQDRPGLLEEGLPTERHLVAAAALLGRT